MVGANKLLLPVGGVPMVRLAAEALLGGGTAPVVCVTGHDSRNVARALAGANVELLQNPDWAAGMSTSLARGLGALERCAAVVVMLGDMPWVTEEEVRALVIAFENRGPDAICVPVHQKRRGNPVLWPARYFPSIQALSGDRGARPLLDQFAAQVVEVPVATDAIHRDVDEASSLPR